MKTRRFADRLWMWCPGCNEIHGIGISGAETTWTWDGNPDKPTVSPSILVQGTQWSAEHPEFVKAAHHRVQPGQPIVCHSFVRAGQWEFLTDSTHDLAGQTVSMVDQPDWLTGKDT